MGDPPGVAAAHQTPRQRPVWRSLDGCVSFCRNLFGTKEPDSCGECWETCCMCWIIRNVHPAHITHRDACLLTVVSFRKLTRKLLVGAGSTKPQIPVRDNENHECSFHLSLLPQAFCLMLCVLIKKGAFRCIFVYFLTKLSNHRPPTSIRRSKM